MTLRPVHYLDSYNCPSTRIRPTARFRTIMATGGHWTQDMHACRVQILENCRFFSARGSGLGVILIREPLGNFKAVVTRTEHGGQRAPLLSSDSADSIPRAYELLLLKSADAVQSYMTTNGFAPVSSPKMDQDVVVHDDDEDADDASTTVSSLSDGMDDGLKKTLADSALSLDESTYDSLTEDESLVRYLTGKPKAARKSRTAHRSSSGRARRSSGSPRQGAADLGLRPGGDLSWNGQRPSAMDSANVGGGWRSTDSAHHPALGVPPAHLRGMQAGAWRAGVAPGAVYLSPPCMYERLEGKKQAPPPVGTLNMAPPTFQAHTLTSLSRMAGLPGYLTSQGGNNNNSSSSSSHNHNNNAYAGLNPVKFHPVDLHAGNTHPANTPRPRPSAPPSTSSLTTAKPTSPPGAPTDKQPTTVAHLVASGNKQPAAPAFPAAIDYRMCIKTRGVTGESAEHRMMIRSPPTRELVQTAALRYVEQTPWLFKHLHAVVPGGSGSGSSSSNNNNNNNDTGGGAGGGGGMSRLRAILTRVALGPGLSDSYDLSTYEEEDLSRLCKTASMVSDMPMFEVVVTNYGATGLLLPDH